MPDLDAIHRVNLESQERLDLPDVLALQQLVAEYLVEAQGAVGGARPGDGASSVATVSGSLNPLTFDSTDLSAVVIETPAMLINYRVAAEGLHESQVVRYTPSDPGQQTTVDASSYASTGTPYLWARRYSLPTDADTRRKWSSGTESTFSLATRQRHRVEWALDPADHRVTTGEPEWFIVARIVSWAGSLPLWQTWHPFDAGLDPSTDTAARWALYRDSHLAAPQSLGVNQALAALLDAIQGIRSNSPSKHPLDGSDPARGVDELESGLAAAESTLESLEFTKRGFIRLYYDGGAWIGDPDGIAGLSTVNVEATSESSSYNGWLFSVQFKAAVLSFSVQPVGPVIATGGSPTAAEVPQAPATIYHGARQADDPNSISIFANTVANLVANGYIWNQPSGNPAVGTRVEITALLGD